MNAAQEAERQRKSQEKIQKKTVRLNFLAILLKEHERIPVAKRDTAYIRELKFKISKCRNELRNMGANYIPCTNGDNEKLRVGALYW